MFSFLLLARSSQILFFFSFVEIILFRLCLGELKKNHYVSIGILSVVLNISLASNSRIKYLPSIFQLLFKIQQFL